MDHKQQDETRSYQTQSSGRQAREYVSSKWESVVATLGLLLVTGSIGFMVFEGIWGDSSPPSVGIEVESIESTEGGYLVKFQATNKGGSTAEALTIEGQISDAEERLETSHITLDFLPSRSKRKGGLFFTRDPRQFQLKLRPLGYKKP